MKVFVIIMLSIVIFFKVFHLVTPNDDTDCLSTVIELFLLVGYILALIFACQLH